MSYPESGNVLIIPAYNAESEKAVQEIQWSQSLRTRSARYYIVRAQNQSKGNADVLLYIQDRFYKDEGSNDYIGKIPGARKEGSQSTCYYPMQRAFLIISQTLSLSTSTTVSSTVRRTRMERVAGLLSTTRVTNPTRQVYFDT